LFHLSGYTNYFKMYLLTFLKFLDAILNFLFFESQQTFLILYSEAEYFWSTLMHKNPIWMSSLRVRYKYLKFRLAE